MAKIKSNVELVYDARNQKSGYLIVEIINWSYDMPNNRYIATVSDYKTTTVVGEEGQVFEERTAIGSKTVIYTKQQIDGLFQIIGNPITIEESYTEEMNRLIAMALLYVTQTDLCDNNKTIFGGNPEDWEIVNDTPVLPNNG